MLRSDLLGRLTSLSNSELQEVGEFVSFLSRIRRDGECWEWIGKRNAQGYGKVAISRRRAKKHKEERAHRMAYRIFKGPIPEGLCVCHECDNPPCCNPDHLFLGTLDDNVQDMISKGRQRSGNRKLTLEQTSSIRRLHKPRHPEFGTSALARRFGVSPTWISKLTRQKGAL